MSRRPRLAAPALERGHQGGRLAADEGAAAAADPQVEAEARCRGCLAEQAELARLVDGAREALDRHRVLLAHVHVTLARAHRVGADDHALEHAVRVALEQRVVHERAGVALVGVADHVLELALRPAARLPLAAGREAGAAAAAQAGALDLVEDGLGPHLERPHEGRVAAERDVVVDGGRVEEAVVAEQQALLAAVEGDLLLLAACRSVPGRRRAGARRARRRARSSRRSRARPRRARAGRRCLPAAAPAGCPGRTPGSPWRGPRRRGRRRAPRPRRGARRTTCSAPCARQPVPTHTAMTLRLGARGRRRAPRGGAPARARRRARGQLRLLLLEELLDHPGETVGRHVAVVVAVER